MELQPLTCALAVERVASNTGGGTSRESYKNATLTVARNEFREVLLLVEPAKKKFVLRHETTAVHRKFAAEGKLTLVAKDYDVKLMISNAPPHKLVLFIKSLAAKLAGGRGKPIMSAKQRLLSNAPSGVDEISPVTQKDVQNLKKSEASKDGLLKMNTASPVSSGRAKRRARLSEEDKENNSIIRSARKPESLSAEQADVLCKVRDGSNVFLTGGGGVGKSFLLKKIIGALPPHSTVVSASTGVAAHHVGGVTLHAFAGMGTASSATLEQCVATVRAKKAVFDGWRKCKHLIVDEISMVDGRFFERLENVAREVRCNKKPFGGIQLILSGDFLQLPPVTRRGEMRVFAFQTEAWSRCRLHSVELTQVRRQSDEKFIRLLSSLRMGQCSKEQEAILCDTANQKVSKQVLLSCTERYIFPLFADRKGRYRGDEALHAY